MSSLGKLKFLVVIGICAVTGLASSAELRPETLKAWERYIELTEKRIHSEIESGDSFVVGDFFPPEKAREFRRNVEAGKVFITKMQTRDEEGKKIDVPKGMIHHWYGVIFVPGAKVDDVVRWAKQYSDRHINYKEVEDSKLLSQEGDVYKIFLRLRRKKIITVHYNSEHVVSYRSISPGRTVAKSTSTKIAELEDIGKPDEREKPLWKDRGFLWRLNSYWRYYQEDGGVLIDCESVSLSRGVPPGVGWLVKQYVNSVPKESLENTLIPIRSKFFKP